MLQSYSCFRCLQQRRTWESTATSKVLVVVLATRQQKNERVQCVCEVCVFYMSTYYAWARNWLPDWWTTKANRIALHDSVVVYCSPFVAIAETWINPYGERVSAETTAIVRASPLMLATLPTDSGNNDMALTTTTSEIATAITKNTHRHCARELCAYSYHYYYYVVVAC